MKPIILIGGGGHAQSVLNAMSKKTNIIGYADLQANEAMGIPYLEKDENVMAKYCPDEYDVHVAVVYSADVNMQLRKLIVEKYKAYHYASIVASSAIVAEKAVLGEGVCVLERAVVKAKKVGNNAIINTGAIVEHGCEIGANTLVATGAIVCGDVKIGENCIIGAGAVVRDGVTICDDAVIGIGTVVTKDIKTKGVYVGSPARMINIAG